MVNKCDDTLVFTLTEITSTMLAHISCVVITYCCLVFLKQSWKLSHVPSRLQSSITFTTVDGITVNERIYSTAVIHKAINKQSAYALAAGLLVLGFLEAKTLNTDDCRGLLCFFLRVPPPLGLLPDGKQASWTRSRQFLCMFISQSATTTNSSFTILFEIKPSHGEMQSSTFLHLSQAR